MQLPWEFVAYLLAILACRNADGDNSRTVTNALPAPTPAINDDVRCVRCGYELNGLPPEGHCPECGLGVERSIVLGKALQDSRPAWIRSIAWAARLGLMSYALLASSVLYSIVTEVAADDTWIVPTAFLLMTACRIPQVVLMWKRENPYATRQLPKIRLGILTLLTLTLIGTIGWSLFSMFDTRWVLYRVPPQTFVMFGVLFILSSAFEFSILHRHARRVLDPRLVEHTTIVGVGLTSTLPFCGGIFVYANVPRAYGGPPAGWFILLSILFVSLLLFWIWATYVLWYLSRRLFKASEDARIAWELADAAGQNSVVLPQRDLLA